jgi:cell division topological specificity factor
MSFLDYFKGKQKKTADVAKGRLQLIIAQERAECGGPDFLRLMHDELLAVVRKYIDVDPSAVRVQMDKDGGCEILEVNITLPEGRDRRELKNEPAPKPAAKATASTRSRAKTGQRRR